MPRKNKFCCCDHVDIAFDDYLLENETFPYLEKISEDEPEIKCCYCESAAIYKLCNKSK